MPTAYTIGALLEPGVPMPSSNMMRSAARRDEVAHCRLEMVIANSDRCGSLPELHRIRRDVTW